MIGYLSEAQTQMEGSQTGPQPKARLFRRCWKIENLKILAGRAGYPSNLTSKSPVTVEAVICEQGEVTVIS